MRRLQAARPGPDDDTYKFPVNNDALDPSLPADAEPRLTLIRALSFSYDAFIVAVLWLFVGVGAVAVNGGRAIPAGTPWFAALIALVTYAYFVYSWVRGGQTIGMRAWRLVLETGTGTRPDTGRATVRFAVGLLLGIDLLVTYVDGRGRSLSDRVAGTRVRRLPRRRDRERSRN